MSDGLMEATHEAQCAVAVMNAADDLAEALLDVRDAALGYSALTLDIANDLLRRAGVQLVMR